MLFQKQKGDKIISNLTKDGYDKYGNPIDPARVKMMKISDLMNKLNVSLIAEQRLGKEVGGGNIVKPEHIKLYKNAINKKMIMEKYGKKDPEILKLIENYGKAFKNTESPNYEEIDSLRSVLKSRLEKIVE